MAVKKKKAKKKAVRKKATRKRVVKRKTARKKVAKKKTVRKKVVRKKSSVKKVVRKKATAKKPVRKTPYKKKGLTMAKKKRKKSTKRTRGSAPRWRKKSTVGEVMTNLLVGIGGAVGSAAIANRSKIPNDWVRAGLPLGAGFALLMSKWGKKDFVAYLSTGAMFMGALSMLKKANPALVEIAGEDYYNQYLPYSDDMSQLEYMGENVDLQGENDDSYFEGDDDSYFEGETVDIDGDDAEDVEWVSADVSNAM